MTATRNRGNTTDVDAGLGLLANDSDVDNDASVLSGFPHRSMVFLTTSQATAVSAPNPGFSGIRTITIDRRWLRVIHRPA